MQFGHFPLALAIATYDWNPKTAAFVVGMHFLPNADSLVVRAGLAKPEFHCTVTHSLAFALVVSGLVAPFSLHYAAFALAAILAHYAADIGSTVGLPLLWPFSRRKFTLALWRDSGYWGREMYAAYYRQPMSWVVEGAAALFFGYRLYVIYA